MFGAQCTVFKGLFADLPPENWFLCFLGSNGCKWVQINNLRAWIPSNVYFYAKFFADGCLVLIKVVTGVNLADPARSSNGRSSFIFAYMKGPQYILFLTTLEYYIVSKYLWSCSKIEWMRAILRFGLWTLPNGLYGPTAHSTALCMVQKPGNGDSTLSWT